MKTLPTIAKELNVPTTTLRYRIASYDEFLPYTTTNKGKEFAEQEQATIALINDYVAQGKGQEEILQLLSVSCIRDVVVVEQQSQTTNEQQDNQIMLARINDNLFHLVEQISRDRELRIEIAELRIMISELQRKRWYQFWKK